MVTPYPYQWEERAQWWVQMHAMWLIARDGYKTGAIDASRYGFMNDDPDKKQRGAWTDVVVVEIAEPFRDKSDEV